MYYSKISLIVKMQHVLGTGMQKYDPGYMINDTRQNAVTESSVH